MQRDATGMTSDDLIVLGDDTPAVAFVYYHEQRVVPLLRRWRGTMTSADELDRHVTGIQSISDDEIAAAARRGARLVFVSRGCVTPKAIEPTNMDLLLPCDQTSLSGWTLMRTFIRHVVSLAF